MRGRLIKRPSLRQHALPPLRPPASLPARIPPWRGMTRPCCPRSLALAEVPWAIRPRPTALPLSGPSVMGENIYPISIPSVVGAAHRSPAPSRLLPFSLSLSPSPSIGPTYERVCCIPRILRIREGGRGTRSRHSRSPAADQDRKCVIYFHCLSLPPSPSAP